MEYATGAPGSAGAKFDFTQAQNNTFMLWRLHGRSATCATTRAPRTPPPPSARELIEVEGVDMLVGTVSSGATATLQELARENQIPLIVAPAAANDITGVAFNEYTFRTSRNNYQDAVNICEYLVTQYTSFVQIAPDYAFGYGGAAGLPRCLHAVRR
jgi:hypothetical protein